MDGLAPVGRKGSPRRATKNLAGRRPGTLVTSPHDQCDRGNQLDDIYDDDSPNRGNGEARPPTRHGHPTDCRQNDGYDSGGSRFSTVGESDGERARRQEMKKSRQRKEAEKRQRVKDKLAECQRQRDDPPECISIEVEEDAPSNSFDGVRTDKVHNPKHEQIMKNAVDSVRQNLAVGRRQGNNFRGTRHPKSSMARSVSPKMNGGSERMLSRDRRERPGNGSERRQRQGQGLTSYLGDDPLDVAVAQQQSEFPTFDPPDASDKQVARRAGKQRGKPGTVEERMGGAMDKLFGGVPKAKKGYGKGGKGLAAYSTLQLGRADTSSSRDRCQRRMNNQCAVVQRMEQNGSGSGDSFSGNADVSSARNRRQRRTNNRCAGAAEERAERARSCSGDSSEGGKRGPSPGKKRKPADLRHGRDMGGHWPNKKRDSPGGSRDDAIDVDETQDAADSQNDDVRSLHTEESSSSPKDRREEDEVDIVAAVAASSTRIPEVNHAQDATPTSYGRSNVWGGSNAKAAMRGMAVIGLKPTPSNNGSGRKNGAKKKGRVDDMHSHLRRTRRQDDLVSSPGSKGGVHDRESNSDKSDRVDGKGGEPKSRRLSRMMMQEPEPEPNVRNGDWISTRKRGKSGNPERKKPIRSNSGMAAKLKRQGGIFEKEDTGDAFDFGPPSSNEPRSKRYGKKQQRQTKRSTQSTGPRRRSTRIKLPSSSKAGGKENEIITIDSSSDEDDECSSGVPDERTEESVAESRPRRRAAGDRAYIDAVRIAVGKKVFNRKCNLSFQFGTKDPYILFTYYDNDGKKNQHSVYLKYDELKEVKYHIASEDENDDTDESMTMIAFRITPTPRNDFDKYSKSYNQEDTDDADKSEKHYISVEVRDTGDFQAMLEQMRVHPTLEIFCSNDSKIPLRDLSKYTQALEEDSQKERKARLGIASRTRSGGSRKKKNSDNKLLLVYPFDADEAVLSEAALGLRELGGDKLEVDMLPEYMFALTSFENDAGDGKGKTSSSRTHYVTIRQDDKDRLCPGQFLNDSLVDFWMRWISRGESRVQGSNVHFFTSHFMTTLKNDGPDAVSSWTAKKNINVFKKRLIFVPVNADLHWSLCVVVNPGLIANNYDNEFDASEEHACILFMDSLKMHSKTTYAKHIRIWLNFEWKRLGKENIIEGREAPFDKTNMQLRSPKIPYQENGCDCGVFVCRYAYNIFQMKGMKFTWEDISDNFRFRITEGPAFQFDMKDIARIREEIETLIDNLSKLYLDMKEKEKANKKAKRREVEKAYKESVSSRNGNVDDENASSDIAPSENTPSKMASSTIAPSESSYPENAYPKKLSFHDEAEKVNVAPGKGDVKTNKKVAASDEDDGPAKVNVAEAATDNVGHGDVITKEKEIGSWEETESQGDSACESAAASIDGAVADKEEDRDTIMASSEEKEPTSREDAWSQHNHALEIDPGSISNDVAAKDADEDVIMASSGEVENISQQGVGSLDTRIGDASMGSITGSSFAIGRDGDVIMISSEEKENISQQEVPVKSAGAQQVKPSEEFQSEEFHNWSMDL